MNSFSPANSVPWSVIQTYLAFLKNHDDQIAKMISLKDQDLLDVTEVEAKITKVLVQMHDTVIKMLKENCVVKNEKSKMEVVIKEVLKIQDTFLSLNSSSQWNTEAIIKSLKPQLETSLGATMSQEVSDMLASMTSVFDESFSRLKSRLDAMEKNIVNAIEQQQNQEISSLKQSLESKEKQIQELISSIGDLKSKDQIINNLTSHKECKKVADSNQENFQNELETMTVMYESLQAHHEQEFMQFKHQAAQELASQKQSYESQLQQLKTKLQHQDSQQSSTVPKETGNKETFVIHLSDKHQPTSPVIEEPVLNQSQCSNDPKEKAYFNEIMEQKKFKTVLRYKGSRDGWKRQDFHRLIDGKGPTATLFKIKENGQCIGGFTSAPWSSEINSQAYNSAMLFNLTTQKMFKCKDHSKAIKCGKDWGPKFGISELQAFEPFNGDNKCMSLANKDGYQIPLDSESNSMLTNLKCEYKFEDFLCSFTVSELEVWEVIFEQ